MSLLPTVLAAALATNPPRYLGADSNTFATSTCSACKEARYCSPAHQKEDWKTHKTECKLITDYRKRCKAVVELFHCE